MTLTKFFSLPFVMVLAAALAGCAGSGAKAGGDEPDPTSLLATTREVDSSRCEPADDALAAAAAAEMSGIELTHGYTVAAGDLWILAARMEAPGRPGNEIATFALTDLDPSGATIYALGPNATTNSGWESVADAGLDVSLDDEEAITASVCARTG